ncbi:MAG: ABC transporter permease [Planctomycetota bacterium]|nr:ABC transporter permease [Planctomycetota bacterium]
MNANIAKGLFLDAIAQVLDNRVFRIMAILVFLPILMTFVIGFREEEIVILFGLERWEYGEWMRHFSMFGTGMSPDQIEDPQGVMIESLSALFVDWIAGNLGIVIAICATAFFVPRMVEKGAADVLFHKPISRLVLFLSRYVAGLLFVGSLTVVMVVGMFLGFLLVSGRAETGLLWAALTLTYLFALVYAVTMTIGIVTRSTVASILLSLMFFFGSGLIHVIWISKEQNVARNVLESIGIDEEETEELDDGDGPGLLLDLVIGTLDTLHYTLPKTTDADIITTKLRFAIEDRAVAYEDVSGFVIRELPDDVEEIDVEGIREEDADLRDLFGEAVFAARVSGSDPPATWTLRRRERRNRPNSHRRERSRDVAKTLEGILGAREGTGVIETYSEALGGGGDSQGFRDAVVFLPVLSTHIAWDDGQGRTRHVVLFPALEWFHALVLDVEGQIGEEERKAQVDGLLDNAGVRNPMAEADWYEEQLGLTSEWKYNILFSVGSSVAFTLVMLLLGWWKLNRIDF